MAFFEKLGIGCFKPARLRPGPKRTPGTALLPSEQTLEAIRKMTLRLAAPHQSPGLDNEEKPRIKTRTH
jgi:hypothetical protein